jgi:hypothetical protein
MRIAWLLPLAALVACAGIGDGGPNLVACLVDEELAVVDPNVAPPGFTLTPAEALSRSVGAWSGRLDRTDDAQVDLTLQIDVAGPLTVQRRSWQTSPNGRLEGAASGLDCEDTYALPVTVTLAAPPDIDLALERVATVTASGNASFDVRIDAADHAGGAAPPPEALHDPAEISAIDLWVTGRRGDGAWSGEVGFGIERLHGADGGPDGTVSYTFVAFGSWTAAEDPPRSSTPPAEHPLGSSGLWVNDPTAGRIPSEVDTTRPDATGVTLRAEGGDVRFARLGAWRMAGVW